MKIESIMWLLPIFFMIHDFEEIIFAKLWVEKNSNYIKEKVPKLALNIISHLEKLSTASFALAVAEEFILLAIIVFCSVQFEWYSFFAAILIGYLLHVIMHFAQGILLKKFIPTIITGIISAIYGIYALSYLNNLDLLNWKYIAILTPVIVLFIIFNAIFAHFLAKHLNIMLERK
ncbi:MAG: HXXEE domain-containing protein [Firmicutes bacterium HGW-Firmicutes-15]|nr:MAG: HXXEE domain-containing protein [Firmicutes bacterium HGW-Firmicutes-15]